MVLEDLGERSHEFAKCYVALVDALRAQGVPEITAREEARMTALLLVFQKEEEGEFCPLCGRGEGEEDAE